MKQVHLILSEYKKQVGASITLFLFAMFAALGSMAQDTIPGQVIRVDTIRIEKVRVDTVREVIEVPVQQQTLQQSARQQFQNEQNKKKELDKSKIYYGGYANFSIGKYSIIGFEPMVAYKLTPKFSVGGKLTYEYIKDKRYTNTYESSNYGVSIFSRLRIFPSLYAHAEFSEMSYKLYESNGESKRKLVPFFYVGGGYSLPITRNTWFTAQVLVDLLQHKDSPYKAWDPYFSAGFGVGF